MDIASIASILAGNKGVGIGTIMFALFVIFIIKGFDFFLEFIKKRFDKKENIKGVLKREEANTLVYELIASSLATMGGKRIQVVEFSNGTRNIVLVPYIYMSCTYEAFAPGQSPTAQKLQRVLTSLYGVFLAKLALSTFIVLNNDKRDPNIPPNIYTLIDERGTTVSLYIKITEPSTHKVIGYMSYDSEDPNGFSEKEIQTLRTLSTQVGMLITLYV